MYNMEISFGSYKFRVEILIIIIIVFWIMFGHILCSCCRYNVIETMFNRHPARLNNFANKEGFSSANSSSIGPEFGNAQTPGYIMNPSTWSMSNLTFSPGATPDAAVKTIWDRSKQQIPLPKGQLDMFATTPFKPECCPNTYSSSTGCACMTVDQYTFLKSRGANNVPYSEY